MNFLSLAEDNEMLEKDWKLIKNNEKTYPFGGYHAQQEIIFA